jgi:hypothetical protein
MPLAVARGRSFAAPYRAALASPRTRALHRRARPSKNRAVHRRHFPFSFHPNHAFASRAVSAQHSLDFINVRAKMTNTRIK